MEDLFQMYVCAYVKCHDGGIGGAVLFTRLQQDLPVMLIHCGYSEFMHYCIVYCLSSYLIAPST